MEIKIVQRCELRHKNVKVIIDRNGDYYAMIGQYSVWIVGKLPKGDLHAKALWLAKKAVSGACIKGNRVSAVAFGEIVKELDNRKERLSWR